MSSEDLPAIVTEVPGPRSRALAARLTELECPAFEARRRSREGVAQTDYGPIVLSRGERHLVVDADGNRYVDLAAGFGALIFGHDPPLVRDAARASGLVMGLGDVYASEVKIAFMEGLARWIGQPGARIMLGLSGADAVTAALKTARLATGKPGVVAFHGAYHGLSHGPLSICGLAPAFREPFADQLPIDASFAPFAATEGELDASLTEVERALRTGRVGAIVVEPVLGRGGCIPAAPGFVHALGELAHAHGALLVADEIWTGAGRAGNKLLSLEQTPHVDLVCMGKGLGAGAPISACVGFGGVMDAWAKAGGTILHTATHFGRPVDCAIALAVLGELERGDWPMRAGERGQKWLDDLRATLPAERVRRLDGAGMMVGIELEGGAQRALGVQRALLSRGYLVLTGGVRGDALTLTPPLGIPDEALRGFADALCDALG